MQFVITQLPAGGRLINEVNAQTGEESNLRKHAGENP